MLVAKHDFNIVAVEADWPDTAVWVGHRLIWLNEFILQKLIRIARSNGASQEVLCNDAQVEPVSLGGTRKNPSRHRCACGCSAGDARAEIQVSAHTWGAPIVCNDGVTIAKEVDLKLSPGNAGLGQ